MVLVCLMEQQILSKDKGVVGIKEGKAILTQEHVLIFIQQMLKN